MILCSLILGALSLTSTDAFARGEHRSGHGGDFSAAKDFNRSDDSKFHAILDHSGEGSSGGFAASEIHKKGPETVTLNGSIQGFAHEDIVGVKHPESKTKSKAESCGDKPSSC